MSLTEVYDRELDATIAVLTVLAEQNVPPDIQELLVHGNVKLGVKPGALSKAIKAAFKAIDASSPQWIVTP